MDDRKRFTGRTVLVTGAGTGIGAALCRRVAGEGANLVLTGRREAPLQQVAASLPGPSVVVPADVAVAEQAEAVVAAGVEAFGTLDVVVANAGGHVPGAAADVGDAAWRYSLHANLDSAFVTVRAALPHLIRARGAVVVVSSIAGLFAGPGVVGYVTGKHALIGLTRSLARDYGRFGVRANAVCPGWVRTAMADEQMDDLGRRRGLDRDQAYALVAKDTPLARVAEPEEIAAVIAFLASPEASAMTGSVVVADCGAGAVDLPTLAFAD
ncbi:SDR family NAD(P)-dependent oxidoreductase [Actinoplanes sp. L3-i22]|uniref:SDR family NAD(P)-dependent oxidoreductase n=1 Tax=Actinoplanes sp. L3-i22 TaxID=2836373 RepID=UPI001C74C35D|nr:SDR family NAD(P)-dependent oxidoreductase [Actinoplanes sp. L3-i22]BCY09347.1 3-oxoacyl-ACP reductase [Actinoplanes sp. L3-i22]